MHTILKLTAALLALALAATAASAMFGGTVVASPPQTGAVAINIAGQACTGTLVSPHWVLTARHCLDPRYRLFVGKGAIAAPVAAVAPDAKHAHPWQRTPIGRTSMQVRAAIRDRNNGRYLVAGVEVYGALRQPLLWSLDNFGAPTSGFGDAYGMSSVDLGPITNGELTALTTVPGGDIIAAGWAEEATGIRMLVMRFAASAAPKIGAYELNAPPASFTRGFEGAPLGVATAVTVDGAGNVVVVGTRTDDVGERWVAAMYDAAGQRRPMFGYLDNQRERGRLVDVEVIGGKVVVTGIRDGAPVIAVLGATAVESPHVIGGGMSEPVALALDSAQRILVAGHDQARRNVVVARITSPTAVTFDPAFDGDGLAVRPIEEASRLVEVVGVEAAAGDAVVVGLGLTSKVEPNTMTALRFTSAGRPDPTFGQDGLIVWSVNDADAEAGGFALGEQAAVLFGNSKPGALVAAAYALAYNPIDPEASVTTGGEATIRVVGAKVHRDAAVDVALLRLEQDAVESDVRFGGFADPEQLMYGATVVCYGAGLDAPENGSTGTLRRGLMTFDKLDDSRMLTLTSICPKGPQACDAVLLGADSGAACFVSDTGETWQQLGVYRGSFNTRPDIKNFEPGHLRHNMTRGDVIAEWVEREATP